MLKHFLSMDDRRRRSAEHPFREAVLSGLGFFLLMTTAFRWEWAETGWLWTISVGLAVGVLFTIGMYLVIKRDQRHPSS